MAKEDVILIEDDRLDLIERNALIEVFGAKVADEILASDNSDDEELDEDLQELIDNAPALDEI